MYIWENSFFFASDFNITIILCVSDSRGEHYDHDKSVVYIFFCLASQWILWFLEMSPIRILVTILSNPEHFSQVRSLERIFFSTENTTFLNWVHPSELDYESIVKDIVTIFHTSSISRPIHLGVGTFLQGDEHCRMI